MERRGHFARAPFLCRGPIALLAPTRDEMGFGLRLGADVQYAQADDCGRRYLTLAGSPHGRPLHLRTCPSAASGPTGGRADGQIKHLVAMPGERLLSMAVNWYSRPQRDFGFSDLGALELPVGHAHGHAQAAPQRRAHAGGQRAWRLRRTGRSSGPCAARGALDRSEPVADGQVERCRLVLRLAAERGACRRGLEGATAHPAPAHIAAQTPAG